MADVKVKLNLRGVNEVMKSAGVQAELRNKTRAIAAAANSQGEGKYVSEVAVGRFIAAGFVRTSDYESRRDNAENNTLLKSMDAGR